ncbi:MAG: UDP-N-acetylmuramoyl-L-alanyl-D-glutamate--2,6-diaminopimelate ligase [Brevinema sp.]
MAEGRIIKTLQQLFPNQRFTQNPLIHSLHNDSRLVDSHSLFIAYTGFERDLHNYIGDAYQRGGRSFFVDAKKVPQLQKSYPDALFVPSNDLKTESALLILAFYDYPDKELCLIGITGTNGKTTTASLINQSLKILGKDTAFFGTIKWSIGTKTLPALNTSPDLLALVKYLKEAVEVGIAYAIMEVTSHALDLGRVEFLNFDYALFTNLTQDHLDYHHTLEEYYLAKSKLFLELLAHSSKKPKRALVNADDAYGQRLLKSLGGRGIPADSLSLVGVGSWNAEQITLTIDQTSFLLKSEREEFRIHSALLGLINVQNLMMAVVLLRYLGYSAEDISVVIQNIMIPGRLQKIITPKKSVFLVDYAHTPDALQKALAVIGAVSDPNKKAIVVFGAGGDRDQTKRPLMAQAVAQADVVIVTSDNPRTEDPKIIIDHIMVGFTNHEHVYREQDRKKALVLAYELAEERDVVLVAGKGHEDYQILGCTKTYFSDYEEILKLWDS